MNLISIVLLVAALPQLPVTPRVAAEELYAVGRTWEQFFDEVSAQREVAQDGSG